MVILPLQCRLILFPKLRFFWWMMKKALFASAEPFFGIVDIEPNDPARTYLVIFILASIGGLAALLRSKEILSVRVVVSAFLYSGITGLAIGFFGYRSFANGDGIHYLFGASLVAGVASPIVMDSLIESVRKVFSGFVTRGLPLNDQVNKDEKK